MVPREPMTLPATILSPGRNSSTFLTDDDCCHHWGVRREEARRQSVCLVRLLACLSVSDVSPTSSLEDLRGDLEDLRGDLENFRGDLEDLRGDLENLRGDLENFRGDLEDLRGDLDDLRGDLEDDLEDLRGEPACRMARLSRSTASATSWGAQEEEGGDWDKSDREAIRCVQRERGEDCPLPP